MNTIQTGYTPRFTYLLLWLTFLAALGAGWRLTDQYYRGVLAEKDAEIAEQAVYIQTQAGLINDLSTENVQLRAQRVELTEQNISLRGQVENLARLVDVGVEQASTEGYYRGAYGMCRMWAEGVAKAPYEEAIRECNEILVMARDKNMSNFLYWVLGYEQEAE